MKSLGKFFIYLFAGILSLLIITVFISKTFNISIGFGNAIIPSTDDEQKLINKYKTKFMTKQVQANHDYTLIKANASHGIFIFSICTEDSIFSFNSIRPDSLKEMASMINIDVQKVLNHKANYDSVSILLCTQLSNKSTEGYSYTFETYFKYPIIK